MQLVLQLQFTEKETAVYKSDKAKEIFAQLEINLTISAERALGTDPSKPIKCQFVSNDGSILKQW